MASRCSSSNGVSEPMRTNVPMRPHPRSRYLHPLIVLLAGAALLLFLFDRQEQVVLSISPAECQRFHVAGLAGEATAESTAGDNGGALWFWTLPEHARPLARAKTPRRESSFLFLGER